ncbi:MAG: hypothetical protein IJZ72_06395 [Oscillospiraceae bacterium]|nr:hypothetical protein [Oscillospiraceae bacterium]
MKNKSSIVSRVFKASLLIYPLTFVIASVLGLVVGIDSGWAMPAMSNHEKMYGWDAIWSYIVVIVWGFFYIYASVLAFQVGYIIVRVVLKIKNKLKPE